MTAEENVFLEIVQDFTKLSPTEADELLSNEEGTIVFIGRPTCPYCRKFAPKLHKVSTEHKVQVNFVNSEHPDYTQELKDFREKYGVPTVPGILYADGNNVKVRCDSSMTEKEIASFVEAS